MKFYPIETLEPMLYKDIFPYDEIPKIKFNHVQLPMALPEEIWITDTTFRDGQQSITSMTKEQIVKLYDLLHRLDNGSGIIRQTEFFVYTRKDREALEKCMSRGYQFPEITTWIRASKEDFKLVKALGVKETGILMSASDYHIYEKLGKTRSEAMRMYLDIARTAVEHGISPRCHFEDITRADFHGFVLPLAKNLMEISRQSGVPVKIRACDTLGVGVSHPGVELPRSVAGIVHGLINQGGVPSSMLEWHDHNDYYAAVTNSSTFWLYGGASVNTTLFGIGERVGNTPLEGMLMEYAQIKGDLKTVDLKVLNEIEAVFEEELGYTIPPRTPFVGKEFNVTKAGIHADGLLKNEEIYNSFDTNKLLGRPALIEINTYSGLAGLAYWMNCYYNLTGNDKISKYDDRLQIIKDKIDEEYSSGRTTNISKAELISLCEEYMFGEGCGETVAL